MLPQRLTYKSADALALLQSTSHLVMTSFHLEWGPHTWGGFEFRELVASQQVPQSQPMRWSHEHGIFLASWQVAALQGLEHPSPIATTGADTTAAVTPTLERAAWRLVDDARMPVPVERLTLAAEAALALAKAMVASTETEAPLMVTVTSFGDTPAPLAIALAIFCFSASPKSATSPASSKLIDTAGGGDGEVLVGAAVGMEVGAMVEMAVGAAVGASVGC